MGDTPKQAGDEPAKHGPPAARLAAQDAVWAQYIARAVGGDEDALLALYEESKSLVHGVAMRMLMDAADAEEVTLDVYTQVWRSAASYDARRGSPSAWLVLLARSRAIDRVRSRKARARVEEHMEDPPHHAHAAESESEEAWMVQERTFVRAAMSALPEHQRRLIELAFFGGFTHAELAQRLNLPLGTVKTRIRSAIGKLKEHLAQRLSYRARGGDGRA